jgi:helicase
METLHNLNLWIAQSESWHTFVDYDLPKEELAKYTFLERPDDFYIALYGRLFEILSSNNLEGREDEILSIAQGLELYSLKKTKNQFRGVNWARNMLYAGALYYLANRQPSAWLQANLYELSDYEYEIDRFIWSFLSRNVSAKDFLIQELNSFLNAGDINMINRLIEKVELKLESIFNSFSPEYTSYELAKHILKKFSTNNLWFDLSKLDIKELKDYISYAFQHTPPIWDLFPSQKTVLSKGLLETGVSMSIQMPTCSGKTAICEILIYNEFKKNPENKVLFLAPFRALASELKTKFCRRLAKLGVKCKAIYGGNLATSDEKTAIENVNLLICTPEKFMAIESVLPNVYSMFKTIICDEGHILDDENRGLSYELLLSKFKIMHSDKRKFIFLSAIIPNIEIINGWLGSDNEHIAKSKYRPTEIELAFLIEGRDREYYLNVNPGKERPKNYQIYKFLTKKDFQFVNPLTKKVNTKAKSIKATSVAVALKACAAGPVVLFSPQKGGTSGIIKLAEEMLYQIQHFSFAESFKNISLGAVLELSKYFDYVFGVDFLLNKLVAHGCAFHHGHLPQYSRELIEKAYQEGYLNIIICTSTLAEGVNLPIRTLVVHSTKMFQDTGLAPMKLRDIKNIIGRTGRAGKETKGSVIVTNKNDFDILKKAVEDIEGENVKGVLFRITQIIHNYIKQNRATLSNEFLENQQEWFKQILDSIDLSVIDLLEENINMNEVDKKLAYLTEQTFAFHQLNDKEKETLKNVMQLRRESIADLIEQDRIKDIKYAGTTPRLYRITLKELGELNNVWTNTIDPLENEWLDLIFGLLSKLPQVIYFIDKFNKLNQSAITLEQLRTIAELWIAGNWYERIAHHLDIEVDLVLRIFSSLIGYNLQIIVANICRIAENELLKKEQNISEVIKNWPLYVMHGLSTKLHLILVDLGFNDRIAIIEIDKYFREKDLQQNSIQDVRSYIVSHSDKIIHILESRIPTVTLKNVRENIDYLAIKNTY